jgi:spore germination cell wall hydrolase CwlJ-like protein
MRSHEFITEIFDKRYFRVRWDERSDWEWVGGFTASDGSNIEILFVKQDDDDTWHVEWSRSGSQDRITTSPKLATTILSTINAVLKQFIRKEQPFSIIVGVTNNDVKKLEVYHKMLGALDYHWEKMSKGEIRQYKLKPNNLWYRYYVGVDNDDYADEEELKEDWKKTLGAIGVAGALAAGAQNTMQTKTAPEVRPAVASTVAPAENPDVSILAQTIWGEARSHGANGMLAVGNVIKNRAEANMKMFGQGIRGVALKPKQFSCWNAGDPNRDRIKEILEYDRLISLRQSPDGTPFDEWFAKFKNSGNYMDYKAWLLAKDIAKKIISDRAPDPTNGAVYYHTTDVNPSWNAKLDHVATVGNHVFYTLPENLSEYKVDNVEGLGSVPYNQNVDYFGLRVMMKPSTFLSLALPLNEPRSVEYIMQHMKDGGALGAPFLYVKIPADWEEGDLMRPASISGHEGRNRMLAIQKLEGDDPVEVHLLLQGGMRARHLNPDMIKELQNGMMNQSRNRYVTGPLFSK